MGRGEATKYWRSVSVYFRLKDFHGTNECYANGCRCGPCTATATGRRKTARLNAKKKDSLQLEPTKAGDSRWAAEFQIRKFRETPWISDAACRGMDTNDFYPDAKQGQSDHYRLARSICRRCPVADNCLAHAIETKERHGLWGGLTERQRRRVERMGLEDGLVEAHRMRGRAEDVGWDRG